MKSCPFASAIVKMSRVSTFGPKLAEVREIEITTVSCRQILSEYHQTLSVNEDLPQLNKKRTSTVGVTILSSYPWSWREPERALAFAKFNAPHGRHSPAVCSAHQDSPGLTRTHQDSPNSSPRSRLGVVETPGRAPHTHLQASKT